MRMFVGLGGWLYGHQIAQALNNAGYLERFVTVANYPPPLRTPFGERFTHIPLLSSLESVIDRIPGVRTALPPWEWKDPLVARILPHYIHRELDLALVFACYAGPAFRKARRLGVPTVLERSSIHIRTQVEQAQLRMSERSIRVQEEEYELADHIVVPSKRAAQTFVDRGVDAKKLSILPLGMDDRLFKRQAIRFRPFRLIFVGALSRQKGVPDLLEAWRSVADGMPDAELILVGRTHPDVAALVRNAGPRVRVHDLVSQEALPALYGSASAFVLPSLQDGFGMVIVEAMSCGLPVIVSKECGASEILQNGVNGLVVDAGHADQIAQAIRRLYEDEDLCRRMADAGHETSKKYSWRAYHQGIVERYTAWSKPHRQDHV